MGGFVDSPSVASLAALARTKRVPLVEDLGSGSVGRARRLPLLDDEPAPQDSLELGAQLVCFSADKLFGGPQAGIIAGKTRLIQALKREPFFRALRCDKLILAALEATTDRYLRAAPEGESPVPVLTMLQTTVETLRGRAETILAALGKSNVSARVGVGPAGLGGGTSPQAAIPSVTIDLLPQKIPVVEIAARLRAARPPVIGYIAGGKFRVDLRTVFPSQDKDLVRALKSAWEPKPESS
jgi:L-seryl-tRNA(Ser) seleniumtransferase